MVQGTWLPLADAARVLGLSIAATRRRAKAGVLPAERRSTPQGGVWWVCVSDDTASPDDSSDDVRRQVTSGDGQDRGPHPGYVNGSASTGAIGPGLGDLVALLREREQKVDELNVQLTETMAVAAMWQERAGMLSDRLALAESKMAALEASHSPVASNLTAKTPDPAPEGSRTQWRSLDAWITPGVILAAGVLIVVVLVLAAGA
jgi:hypothetical protein